MKPFHNIAWLVALVTIFFGQLYMRPFYSDFRFSMGVVVFAVFLLLYDLKMEEVVLITASILIFRVLLAFLSGIPFTIAFVSHYPSALFYLCYYVILITFKTKSQLASPLIAFIIIFFADSFSNWLELFFRGDLDQVTIALKAQSIFLTAILRATLILIGFFLIKFYPEMFQKENEKRKMATWIIHQSKLYNEVVFINKSEEDIENAMKKAHQLYRLTKQHSETLPKELDFSRQVLSISRDVHEIKKDYRRIRQALTALIPRDLPNSIPDAHELVRYLCDDLETYALSLNRNIIIERQVDKELPQSHLFDYLSLVNNLAVNAIESIESKGLIEISLLNHGSYWQLVVTDNGSGITPEELPLIFDAGYSTKYDPTIGEMSTGLGLSQVDYIVTHILKGTLTLSSTVGTGSTFNITFPNIT